MASETDRLLLSNSELFTKFRANLLQDCSRTKNLVECRDHMLYVWNGPDEGILTLNIKTKNPPEHQTLMPTDPPLFAVEHLLVNGTATHLTVFGQRGIALFDLPRRWGKDGNFQGGKKVVACKCSIIEERYFVCNPQIEIRQVRWHPGSRTDSHLLVLVSDNTFRLYETGGVEPRLREVWPVGRTPTASLSTSRMPLLASLGDTAVDFDFARPLTQPATGNKFVGSALDSALDQHATGADTMWPILVLRGNGDVYSVTASLASNGPLNATFRGPLAMYPSDNDNYGVDACSILCLESEPPIVVIATCSGTLYHCVLLDNEEERTNEEISSIIAKKNQPLCQSRYGSTYSLNSPEIALYVFEAVELELGLTLDENNDDYNCPIHLHHDIATKSRYFCSHNTGVHVMCLPLVPQLEQYLNAKENEVDQHIPSMQPNSSAEYLICTRTSSSPVSPLLGLTFTDTPTMLIAVLCNGEVVSLPLVTMSLPPLGIGGRWDDDGEVTSNENSKLPFEEHIRQMLKHDLHQPILKFAPNADLTPQKCLELVSRSTQILRDEYFSRHNKVRDEIERRAKMLENLKNRQLVELADALKEKAQLRQTAEELAEKYEDINTRQEMLTARAEQLLRQLSSKQPTISSAERKLAEDLSQIKAKVVQYKMSLEQIKAKQAFQKTQKQQWGNNQQDKQLSLTPTQLKTTKNALTEMTEGISDLKKLVLITKKELGI